METNTPNFPSSLLKTLRFARQVVVLTGAGVSAESGIATFRDAQSGLWSKFRAEDLATPEAFRRDPVLVWNWYAERRQAVAAANPNPAHRALVEIEKRVPGFLLVTQNIDGLHKRAGSRNLVELHGNISRVKCFENNHFVESWPEDGEIPPRCPECESLLRPDVVWFGEMLPVEDYRLALAQARTCDLFFSIGTSGLVEPAASLPRVAAASGATVVTINLEVANVARYKHYSFNGKAGELLSALVKQAWPE